MKELLTVIKKWMTRILSGIATVLLSVMTLLVLYQVFTRYVLNSPAAFTEPPTPLSPGNICAWSWCGTA